MSTELVWSKSGLKLVFDVSAQPEPRVNQCYPYPDIPVQDGTVLALSLEAVAQTGRTGIRVTYLGETLPGGPTAVWSLVHAVIQGNVMASEEISIPGTTLNVLLDQAMPAALHTFALKRYEAGQVTVWPSVAIATPDDPTLAIANSALTSASILPNWDSELGPIQGVGGNLVYDTTQGGTQSAGGFNGSRYVRAINIPAAWIPSSGTYGSGNVVVFNGPTDIPAHETDQWMLKAWVKRISGTPGATDNLALMFQWLDENGAPLTMTLGSTVINLCTYTNSPVQPVGEWVQIGFLANYSLPASYPTAHLSGIPSFVQISSSVTGDSQWYVDNVVLLRIPVAAPATTTTVGTVKAGSGLTVAADGTLSHAPATASTIGGVKVGSGLTVDADGTLHAVGSGGAATWGSISGTLSNQTDLQAALNAKASLSGAPFTGAISAPSATFTGLSIGSATGRINGTSILVLNAAAGQTLYLNNDSGALVSFGPGNVATINSATGVFSGTSATFSGLSLGAGPVQAGLWKDGRSGLSFQAAAGSSYDMVMLDPTDSFAYLYVPTGTSTLATQCAFSGTSATFEGILQLDGAVSSYVPAIQINWPGVNRLGIGPESATVWKVGLATGGAWSGNTGSWALHVNSSAAVALQVDGGIQTGGTLTTPYAATFQHYQAGWGDNANRIWLNKGWDSTNGDWLYLGATGNLSNSQETAMFLGGGTGLTLGRGTDAGTGLTGSPWFQVTPAGAGYLNGSPILTVANVGTNAATLQAAISSATAPSVGTSTQMYAWVPPSGLYPYFYATDLVNSYDGSMGALYRWSGSAWVYQSQPQVITPKLTAGNISAGAIGALAVSANDVRSNSYSPGTSTVAPSGFRLSGNAFTATLLDGTTISAIAEIGGDVSIGGCKAAVITNRTMGNTIIQNGAGSVNVVIPEGITSIVLTIQAAGGNGGGGYGSGGGAGTYFQQRIAVRSHNTYRLTIGAPGSNSTFAWVSWDGTLASDSGFATITVACGVTGSTSSGTGASGYDGTIAQDPETGWANVPATGGDGCSYGYGTGKGGSGGSCGNHRGGAGATTTVNKTTSGGGGAGSVMGDGGSGSLTGFNGQPGGTGAGGGGGLAGGAGGPGFGRCQW